MRELRFDPIRNRWVIVVPERARRPSDYLVNDGWKTEESNVVACPFCEGNEGKTPPEISAIRRPGTAPNTPGWRVRVVANKFPALRVEDDAIRYSVGMFDVVSGAGAHEVIIETPDHRLGLADLTPEGIGEVLLACRDRIRDLCRDPRLRYILVFKNHRLEAGASLAHTHCQLIATPMVPPTVKQELVVCREHYRTKERCFICDMLKQETSMAERIVYESNDYVVWSPFASSFPFEMWILPRAHLHDFSRLSDAEISGTAPVLKSALLAMKTLLSDPPYNLVLHTAPPMFRRPGYPDHWNSIDSDYHWHIEIIPRLTRIAGFEWGAGLFINPTPPELAAEYLRREVEKHLQPTPAGEDAGHVITQG